MKLFLGADTPSSTSSRGRDRAREKSSHGRAEVGLLATSPVDFEVGVVGEDTGVGEEYHEGNCTSSCILLIIEHPPTFLVHPRDSWNR